MKIYLILARFGDVYMVCRQRTEPSFIATTKQFSKIVKELFPQHTVIIVPHDIASAVRILQHTYPDCQVHICQQDGTDIELVRKFRNYQKFQEFYAAQ